jgi:hypothetical protein
MFALWFLSGAVAWADAGPGEVRPLDLQVKHAPPRTPAVPRQLALRQAPTSPGPGHEQATPNATPPRDAVRPFTLIPTSLEDLSRRVIFRLQLGYGVDQGEPYLEPQIDPAIRLTRLYTYGDVVAGTTGVLHRSLSSYLGAKFYFDQEGAATYAAIPSVYDRTGIGGAVLIRSAYVDATDFGPRWLRPLTVRAGRQYRYGLAVAHFDGLTLGYATKPFEAIVFAGRRVALYGPGSDPFLLGKEDPGTLTGMSLRLRLRHLKKGVPLALGVDLLGTGDGTGHIEPSIDVDLGNTTFGGRLRLRGGRFASWRTTLRTRLGATTTVLADVASRLKDDWLYDLVLAGLVPADERLGLGRVRLGLAERLRATVRAGTLLFGSWDLLLQGALGVEHDQESSSSFLPSYGELGAGVVARFPYGLSAGVEGRARVYARQGQEVPELPDTGALGETSFQELVGTVRFDLGVRRFSTELEVYGRRYGQREVGDVPTSDLLAGGRFRLEGWMGPGLRISGEYEVTLDPGRLEPYLTGFQSLRVVGEASF